MGIVKVFTAVCSNCGDEFEDTFEDQEELKSALKEAGWSDNFDLCEECTKEEEEDDD